MTDFSGDVECYTVTGKTNGMGHMWNIVEINGRRYLADVTNSDSGTIGQFGGFFLISAEGSIQSGYQVETVKYVYDSSVIAFWGQGSDSILNLNADSSIGDNDNTGGNDNTGDKDDEGTVTVDAIPMYRLYNPNSGEHFYTGFDFEREFLISIGWHDEGVGFYAPTEGKPVYRLYNENSGDHHYTPLKEESDWLVSLGWNYEGEAWKTGTEDMLPLYRLYNPNAKSGSHHYTSFEYERDWLISIGWKDEGIGWYGVDVRE